MKSFYIDCCPFCKYDKPAIVCNKYTKLTGQSFDEAWITCPMCDAEGPHESIPCKGKTVIEAAIEAWNER